MTDVPHFKLARVYDDGTSEPAEIVPLLEIPQDTDMGRRGFLGMGAVFGAGIAATGAIATMPNPAEAAGKKKKKTSSKKKKKKPGPLAAHIGIVRAIDLATNGKSIATGGDDKRADDLGECRLDLDSALGRAAHERSAQFVLCACDV